MNSLLRGLGERDLGFALKSLNKQGTRLTRVDKVNKQWGWGETLLSVYDLKKKMWMITCRRSPFRFQKEPRESLFGIQTIHVYNLSIIFVLYWERP